MQLSKRRQFAEPRVEVSRYGGRRYDDASAFLQDTRPGMVVNRPNWPEDVRRRGQQSSMSPELNPRIEPRGGRIKLVRQHVGLRRS